MVALEQTQFGSGHMFGS